MSPQERLSNRELSHLAQSAPLLSSRAVSCSNALSSLSILLHRDRHIYYLISGLNSLSGGFSSLDASRPWLVYWIIQSLALLGYHLPKHLADRCIDTLRRCWHPEGGFGGGPMQCPHLAPTYAAINALAIIGTPEAYDVIDRKSLYKFLIRMKRPNGSFTMTDQGESDTRCAYTALAVASLTNLLTPELTENTAEWIASCQTYEGGISAEPYNEAHGGYAFCGLAGLLILKKQHLLNMPAFIRWSVSRQMSLEGGFQGRTNKLVDGCYSFWVGALFPLIDFVLSSSKQSAPETEEAKDAPVVTGAGSWLLEEVELQKYILICCQEGKGGLKDKPGKWPDFYHTCYCLSGLSIAQHAPISNDDSDTLSTHVLGPRTNLLESTNPIYNVPDASVQSILEYFSKLPSSHAELSA